MTDWSMSVLEWLMVFGIVALVAGCMIAYSAWRASVNRELRRLISESKTWYGEEEAVKAAHVGDDK